MKLVLSRLTVPDLTNAVEAVIECRDGLHAARCQTGDSYEAMFLQAEASSTEASLVERMGLEIESYMSRREEEVAREPGIPAPLRLYWRYAAPHIFAEWNYETQRFEVIRTRLVVTNKPEIYADEDAYAPVRDAELEQEHFPVVAN